MPSRFIMLCRSAVAQWIARVPYRATTRRLVVSGAVLLGCASITLASSAEDAKKLYDEGDFAKAAELLARTVEDDPANEPARILYAEALEKLNKRPEAQSAWRDLLQLSRVPANEHVARKAISRLRRLELDETDIGNLASADSPADAFKIPMPDIDWKGLEIIEDTRKIPSPIPVEHPYEVPPYSYETEHFTVYSHNETYSKLVAERAEIYLRFMLERLFGGKAWAVRFPIIVYSTVSDYNSNGGPQGSGGVTFGHVTGKTTKLLFFQLRPEWRRSGKGGGGDTGVWKYGLESVLPHELTHAVINEFFGRQEIPQWLHEAVAGRFEQTREHYFEAARLARSVVGGEYFRMRDLFEQEGYPERISQFYEQSAIVVLYLFEAGAEAMNVFLTELAQGNGHDAACAAVLGVPKEGAVEEFERRWVEWMKVRYIKNLDIKKDDTIVSDAAPSKNAVFRPWVNETDTFLGISDWRDLSMENLDGFHAVGASKADWSASSGVLVCDPKSADAPSVLGIRMNELAPVAVSCDVRYRGSPGDGRGWFGFTQLDAGDQDTRVETLAHLSDGNRHAVVALWSDDLALYVDGECVGRYPANQVGGDQADVDYPLAFLTYGPVEIQNCRAGKIQKFSDKALPAAEPEKDDKGKGGTEKEGERPRRGSRRERNKPAAPPAPGG